MKELLQGFAALMTLHLIAGMIGVVIAFSGCAANARGMRVKNYKPRVSHSKLTMPKVRVRR